MRPILAAGQSADTAESHLVEPHALVTALRTITIIVPAAPVGLLPLLRQLLPPLLLHLSVHYSTAVRYMAAVTVAALARRLTLDVMTAVVDLLLPRLADPRNVLVRQVGYWIRLFSFVLLPNSDFQCLLGTKLLSFNRHYLDHYVQILHYIRP